MLEWERCEACGARRGPDAEWCGQCYAPVPRPAESSAEAAVAPPTAPTPASGHDGLELVEVRSEDGAEAPDGFLVLRHEAPVVTKETRTVVTGAVVALGAVTDLLFFPHLGYMLAYGAFVAIIGTVTLRRLWRHSAPAGSRDNFI